MADVKDMSGMLMAVILVGLTFLIMATFALINSSTGDSFGQVSTVTSETLLIGNGSSSTLSSTPTSLVVTTNENSYIYFDSGDGTFPFWNDDGDSGNAFQMINLTDTIPSTEIWGHFSFSYWVNNSERTFGIAETQSALLTNKPFPADLLTSGGNGIGWSSTFQGNTVIDFQWNNGTKNSTWPDTDLNNLEDRWVHIVGVYDGFNVTLYRDGVLEASSSDDVRNVTGPIGNTRDLYIASHPNASASAYEGWEGAIDEVRLYNRTLTQAEVIEINSSGMVANGSLPEDDLIIWLSMNENTGNIVYNKAPNAIANGTLIDDRSVGYVEYQTTDTTTLTEDADYTLSGSTFTLINDVYSWALLSLSETVTEDTSAKDVLEEANTNIQDNTSIAGMILTVSLIGIVLSILIGVFLTIRARRI